MTNAERIAQLDIATAAIAKVRADLSTPGPDPSPEITAAFSAVPATIDKGQTSVLTWMTTGADTVTLQGVAVPAAGSQTVTPSDTTDYVLEATNTGHQTKRTVNVRVRPSVPVPPVGKLVQAGNLAYLYAFSVPADPMWLNGGWALGFNPLRNSLMAAGHPKEWQVSEFSVPAKGGNATTLQKFADPLHGKRETVDGKKDDGVWLGGLLPVGDRLFVTAFCFYDAEPFQTTCLFRVPLDMTGVGPVEGPVAFSNAGAGMVDGYLTPIPLELQNELGGTAASGQSGIPITRRTSSGPDVNVWTPGPLTKPMPGKLLLGYPFVEPPVLPHSIYNLASYIPGAVIPAGFRSVLFIGAHGDGPLCYGTGQECNDPTDPYKGYHAYPYVKTIWAYAVDDLLLVKAGTKKLSDLRPYAQWSITLPGAAEGRQAIRGVAIDHVTNRLFVAAIGASPDRPVIHVFSIS